MDAKTVGQWLDRITAWTGSVRNSEEQSNNVGSFDVDELRAFLRELHDQLVEFGGPTVVLKHLPNVGQLLGKLCCNNVLMIQEADYQLVLQCVLVLYTSQPGSLLEEKAIKWVQLLESLVEDLNKVPSTRWDSLTNCLVPSVQLSSSTLRDVTELCLPMVTSCSSAAPLVECLLSCHGNDTKDAISLGFLKAVMATQEHAYTNQCCCLELSYNGRISLWTRYLPALESEFLHLVGALVPSLPASELGAKQLILSRQLPKACVENPSLLTAVDTLMGLLLQHTQGSASTLTLMDLFNQCVKESQRSLPVPHRCSHRRPGMESLYTQLQADPQELPLDLLTLHMNNISNCLTRTPATDPAKRFQAWLLLVQSQVWYHVVIRMLLLGTADNAAACLNILAWYNIPLVPNRHQRYKVQLCDLVTSLRGLCSKSSLQAHDLHYAFSQLHGRAHQDSHIHNAIRPLLMLFTVHANGAHQILQEIVRMASGEEQPSAVTTFAYLLDSIEFTIMSDIPRSSMERSKQALGDRGKLIARTLCSCKEAYDEYQREESAGTVIISELSRSLLGRYDRIHKLLS